MIADVKENKQTFYKKYFDQSFPDNLISQEIAQEDKDLIFLANSTHKNPDTSKYNLSDSFYFEDKKKNFRQFNKGAEYNQRGNISKGEKFPNRNEGKKNDLNHHLQNLTMSKEESFHINQLDPDPNDTMPKVEKSLQVKSLDLSDNHKVLFNEKVKGELSQIPVEAVEVDSNYNFRKGTKHQNAFVPVDFKKVYQINDKLKYSKDNPLWYIYHEHSKSSFGPISSVHLEEIYHHKNIDGQTEVRLIDVFKVKDKGPFSYFKLKDVETNYFFTDCIESSYTLLKLVDQLNKVHATEEYERENEKKNKDRLIEVKKNAVKPIATKKTKVKYVDINEHFDQRDYYYEYEANLQPIKKEDPLLINNGPSVIDKEFAKEIAPVNKDKKWKKKPKGKPVDLNLKTGFFTMSKQEKEYHPIYICGELENEEK